MSIENLQKKLEVEAKELEAKSKFISELYALMKKHGQSDSSLMEILTSTEQVTKKKPGRPPKKANASKKPASTKRKKTPPRPLRSFKNTKTGETLKTKAPQVNKTVQEWAKSLKVDWRTLEV